MHGYGDSPIQYLWYYNDITFDMDEQGIKKNNNKVAENTLWYTAHKILNIFENSAHEQLVETQ